MSTTWILTCSPENHAATREHGFGAIWLDRSGTTDIYPWRFATRPEHVLEEDEWIPAESLVDALDHIQKWPRAHWTLAFQGQLRPVSAHDERVLVERLRAAASVAAGS